ncbi:hypothetical protein [Fulvimarina sp. MAC8]|uniref:hypothetical protein n=1 Tax=Fulvimarina sp. MAC8 TaxID=3162874 RepID=UPI0032F0028F
MPWLFSRFAFCRSGYLAIAAGALAALLSAQNPASAQPHSCEKIIQIDELFETEPGTIGFRITGDPIDQLRVLEGCQNSHIQTINTYKTLEIFINTSNYCPRNDAFCRDESSENALLVAARISSFDEDVVRNLGPGSIYRGSGWLGPPGTSIISARSYENSYRRLFTTVEELSEFYLMHRNSGSASDFAAYDEYVHARTPLEGHPSWALKSVITQLGNGAACAGDDSDCSARFYLFKFITRSAGRPNEPMRAEIVMNLATRIELFIKGYPEDRYNRRLTLEITTPTPTPRPENLDSDGS